MSLCQNTVMLPYLQQREVKAAFQCYSTSLSAEELKIQTFLGWLAHDIYSLKKIAFVVAFCLWTQQLLGLQENLTLMRSRDNKQFSAEIFMCQCIASSFVSQSGVLNHLPLSGGHDGEVGGWDALGGGGTWLRVSQPPGELFVLSVFDKLFSLWPARIGEESVECFWCWYLDANSTFPSETACGMAESCQLWVSSNYKHSHFCIA